MWFKFPQLWKHFPWYDRSSCNYHKHARWEANLEYLICLFIFNSSNMHVSSKMQHIKRSHFPPTLPFVLLFFGFFFSLQLLYYMLFCAACNFFLAWGPTLAWDLGRLPGAHRREGNAAEAREVSLWGTPFSYSLSQGRECQPAGTTASHHVVQSKMVGSSVIC